MRKKHVESNPFGGRTIYADDPAPPVDPPPPQPTIPPGGEWDDGDDEE